MPLYEGSLHDLISSLNSKQTEVPNAKIETMLYQILDALNFVHTYNPQIIHRDIKPTKILYQGDKFLLTAFGIAKVADISKTIVGSWWHMAPEVRQNSEQTPGVDIWARSNCCGVFGATPIRYR